MTSFDINVSFLIISVFFFRSAAPTLSPIWIERNKSITGIHYHGTALQFKWTLTPCDIHEMSMWVPEQTSCQHSRQAKFYFLWLGTTGQPMSPSPSYPITFGSTQGNWLQHWLFSIPVGCMNNWPIWCPGFYSLWKHHSTVISHETCVYIACLSIRTWKSSSKTISNKGWHSYALYHFPVFILISLDSSEQITLTLWLLTFFKVLIIHSCSKNRFLGRDLLVDQQGVWSLFGGLTLYCLASGVQSAISSPWKLRSDV